jgi:hypothetical protein
MDHRCIYPLLFRSLTSFFFNHIIQLHKLIKMPLEQEESINENKTANYDQKADARVNGMCLL